MSVRHIILTNSFDKQSDFLNFLAAYLARGIFDHSLLLLSIENFSIGPKSFIVLDCCLSHPSFLKTMEEA